MIRKLILSALLVTMSLFGIIITAVAQDDPEQDFSGSISGVVYRDVNANGICTDEDEPGVSGIPLQFVFREDESIANLTSGSEGYFELMAAGDGTWQVTVNPGSGWRVTSQQTRQVLVMEDEPDVEEIDFCIVQVSVSGGAGGTGGEGGGGSQPVLPESGAPFSPSLIVATGLGMLFLAAGAVLFVHSRR